ncbi:MAG: hypothetical protein IPL96_11985 [Holophagaceae bacterium]|nr:hypothetical protein [Holophagaceae bacterium]
MKPEAVPSPASDPVLAALGRLAEDLPPGAQPRFPLTACSLKADLTARDARAARTRRLQRGVLGATGLLVAVALAAMPPPGGQLSSLALLLPVVLACGCALYSFTQVVEL